MTQILLRRGVSGPSGTAGTWAAVNPTLAEGEVGYETDTGYFKIGKKVSGTLQTWSQLGYANSGYAPSAITITNAFSNSGTYNGTSAITLDLPATIARNAQTASKLVSTVNINGTSFDGSVSGGYVMGSAIYSTSNPVASGSATFTKIYASPLAYPPTGTINNGDIWITW
jgi:hypothetical protein